MNEETNIKERKVVCFTHIPKTAGTSLDQTLFRPIFREEEVWNPKGGRELLFSRRSCAYVPGHNPFGVHRFVSGQKTPLYYTILRNPIERAISFYYECLWPRGEKKVADHSEHPTAWEHDLVDFYHIPRFRNVQTRMVAGLWATRIGRYIAPDQIGVGKMVLSAAKRHLENEYRAFGLTERFRASRRWIADTLEKELDPIEKKYKSNPQRPTVEDLSSTERDALRRLNRLDVEFYEYACNLFEKERDRT